MTMATRRSACAVGSPVAKQPRNIKTNKAGRPAFRHEAAGFVLRGLEPSMHGRRPRTINDAVAQLPGARPGVTGDGGAAVDFDRFRASPKRVRSDCILAVQQRMLEPS